MNTTPKAYHNSFKESIIWKNPVLNFGTDIINIELAGITYPDKNYMMHRTRRTKRLFDNLFVIEYVTSGVGYIEAEGKRATVSEGDLYIIHRHTVHTYYADKDTPFEKKWINVSGTYINALSKVFFDKGPFTVLHLGEQAEHIMDEIHSLLCADSRDSIYVNEMSMQLLLKLFLLMDAHRRESLRTLTQFEQISEFIAQNLATELTIPAICDRFYISSATLYRMFTANTGMSPKAYIQSKKIEAAKRMIAANDSTFNIIAASLGFYDSHHFFRVFRSVTGQSPSEYKKQLLENEK